MKDFSGRIAVVTGGGSGMGRELVRQLVAEGCAIAMCDVSARGMAETQHLCEAVGLPQGLRVTSHVADVMKLTCCVSVTRFQPSTRLIAFTCCSTTPVSVAVEA